MTVDGVEEPQNTIHNEEHNHIATAKRVTSVGPDGTEITTTTDNGKTSQDVSLPGHDCVENSYTENLDPDEVWTGDWEDALNFATIIVGIKSSHDSATDGLVIEHSSDGTNVTQTDDFTISANAGKVFTFCPANRYIRIKYTNGSSTTTSFNIQTIMKRTDIKGSSHRINDSIVAEDDAELVKAVLSGVDEDGTFQNVQTTRDGDLTISDNSSGLAIAKGNVTGTSFIHKFGHAPDFDTGDGEVDIWSGSDDANAWRKYIYNYSATADIQYISSNNGGDTVDIEVQGLDANYDLVTQTKTLTGQTSATLDTPLIRVFRMKNVNGTPLVGYVFCSTTAAPAGGVPTVANIRAIIEPGDEQTEMAIYTVPAGKSAYIRSWFGSSAGAKKATNYVMKLMARPFGGVFQLKHRASIGDGNPYQHSYVEPEGPFGEKTDIKMTAQISEATITDASVSAGFDIILVDN